MNAFWWAVVAASIWGFVPLLEKSGLERSAPLAGLFYRCLGVLLGLVLLLIFKIRPQQLKGVDVRSALFLIAGGFLASFVAQIAFYKALKTGEVSRVVPISGSYPLLAFLFGIWFFHEILTPLKIAGIILIILGIWVLKIG